MPTVLLIAIPVVVVILFLGIMNLPDEEIKSELLGDPPAATLKSVKKKSSKKK